MPVLPTKKTHFETLFAIGQGGQEVELRGKRTARHLVLMEYASYVFNGVGRSHREEKKKCPAAF